MTKEGHNHDVPDRSKNASVAGPGDLAPDRPAGMVFTALAWDGGVRAATHSWTGTRDEVRRRTAKMALNMVRLHLLRS